MSGHRDRDGPRADTRGRTAQWLRELRARITKAKETMKEVETELEDARSLLGEAEGERDRVKKAAEIVGDAARDDIADIAAALSADGIDPARLLLTAPCLSGEAREVVQAAALLHVPARARILASARSTAVLGMVRDSEPEPSTPGRIRKRIAGVRRKEEIKR